MKTSVQKMNVFDHIQFQLLYINHHRTSLDLCIIYFSHTPYNAYFLHILSINTECQVILLIFSKRIHFMCTNLDNL